MLQQTAYVNAEKGLLLYGDDRSSLGISTCKNVFFIKKFADGVIIIN
jgi:hypothetical protein